MRGEKCKGKKKKYELAYEGSSNGIYVFQGEKLKFVNEALAEISGYSREELKSMNFLDLVHPDHREDVKRWTEQALTGDTSGLPDKEELKALRNDGSSVWVQLTPSLVEDDGKPAIVGNVTDITDRKRAEEREDFLHSLLRHDVRNKAQIAQGYLELLKETELSEEQEKLVEKAIDACERGNQIIKKVKNLRKLKEHEEVREKCVGNLISKVVAEHDQALSEKNIDVEYGNLECDIRGGPLLKELFTNLLENSITHSECDKIRVSSEKRDQKVTVKVEDDGKGLPDEDKEKIFEKGFKRGRTAGSGLGLHLVKEIAERYGGSVEVKDSELGGTRFDVHLKEA